MRTAMEVATQRLGEAVRGYATGVGIWVIFCAVALGSAPSESSENPWVWWWPLIVFGPLVPLLLMAVAWLALTTVTSIARRWA